MFDEIVFYPYLYGKTFIFLLITSFSQYTTICFVSFVYSVFNEHFGTFVPLVEMMGFDSRANCALGLPRSQTSTGSLLCTDSPSNPLLFITNSLPHSLLGGDDGIRTHDPLLAGQVLSQLSYTPIFVMGFCFLHF